MSKIDTRVITRTDELERLQKLLVQLVHEEKYDEASQVRDRMRLIQHELDEETIYQDKASDLGTLVTIAEISEELKRYLARRPEALYGLTPRKFEELVADIMASFGFDVELTKSTRDGGRDMYVYVKNPVTSFLMFLECKKWAPDRPVGIDIVQRLFGVAEIHNANKSMIVTTSFFTEPAKREQQRISNKLDLRDYVALKGWLEKFR